MIGSFNKYILAIVISILVFLGSIITTIIFNQSLNDDVDKIKCISLGIILIVLITYFNYVSIKINIFSLKKTIDSHKGQFFIFWIIMTIIAITIEILLLIWTIFVLKYGTFNTKTKGVYNSGWAWNNFAVAKAFILGDKYYAIVLGELPVIIFWISFWLILIWLFIVICFEALKKNTRNSWFYNNDVKK